MIILCLHVPATPVVFGRAWRRDLDHVYRVSINTFKNIKNYVFRKSTYNLQSKIPPQVNTILNKGIAFGIKSNAKDTPKYF